MYQKSLKQVCLLAKKILEGIEESKSEKEQFIIPESHLI